MIELKSLPENRRAIEDLQVLGADLQKKGVVSSLHSAAGPLVTAEKAGAPDDPKTGGSRIAQAINKIQAKGTTTLQTSNGKRNISVPDNVYALIVGPNKGGKKDKVGWLGHILEVGAKKHTIANTKKLVFRVFAPDGLSYKKNRITIYRPIKFTGGDGRFASGAVEHPGFGQKRWIDAALAAAEPQMDERFYQGLNKWIARNGR